VVLFAGVTWKRQYTLKLVVQISVALLIVGSSVCLPKRRCSFDLATFVFGYDLSEFVGASLLCTF
jgi:hypothetical protein